MTSIIKQTAIPPPIAAIYSTKALTLWDTFAKRNKYMANIISKAVSGLLEMMLTPATVIAVRPWTPATMYEVDIKLQTTDMDKWTSIKRVKCKVDDWAYRDYTPANWNPDTRICTMYIESGHDGAGSRWVQQLRPGNDIGLGAAHAAPLPAKEGKILCLADGSALGHCMALRQLTDPGHYPMDGAIFLHDDYQVPASLTAQYPELELLVRPQEQGIDVLSTWMAGKDLSSYTSVYLAGNIPMVSALRKKLKTLPEVQARVYTHGFWS